MQFKRAHSYHFIVDFFNLLPFSFIQIEKLLELIKMLGVCVLGVFFGTDLQKNKILVFNDYTVLNDV